DVHVQNGINWALLCHFPVRRRVDGTLRRVDGARQAHVVGLQYVFPVRRQGPVALRQAFVPRRYFAPMRGECILVPPGLVPALRQILPARLCVPVLLRRHTFVCRLFFGVRRHVVPVRRRHVPVPRRRVGALRRLVDGRG